MKLQMGFLVLSTRITRMMMKDGLQLKHRGVAKDHRTRSLGMSLRMIAKMNYIKQASS